MRKQNNKTTQPFCKEATQRLLRAVLVQAITDSMDAETWVVEVTEQSKLGTFSAVCYGPTIEEGVRLAKLEIRSQRPRFRGSPVYTVRAAKLNEEAEEFLFSQRSDLNIMSQGVSDPEAFRIGMQQRMTQQDTAIAA